VAQTQWKSGRDMRTLILEVKERADDMKKQAVEALELSIEEGARATQDNLEAATTRTGLARARGQAMVFDPMRSDTAGTFPGRHDSGNMVGSVSSEVRTPRAKIVWGVFGWWGANYEEYFRDQDLGEGNIPAARALPQAEVMARENFRRRMQRIVDGKGVS